MNTEVILVRYGELALKGKNRSDFEDRLVRNIRQKLASIPDVKVVKSFGRIFVETDRSHSASVLRGLGDVFGVVVRNDRSNILVRRCFFQIGFDKFILF